MPGYAAAAYIPQLVIERPIFLREVADGCYKSSTFLLAKIVEEFLIILPFTLAYTGCIFGAISLQGNFWIVFLVVYLLSCWGLAVAYLIGAISPNADAANALLPTYITINIIFAGFVIIISDIPVGWRWYPWCNPTFYGWNALMKNNFQDSFPFNDERNVKAFYGLRRTPGIWASVGILALFVLGFVLFAGMALHRLV